MSKKISIILLIVVILGLTLLGYFLLSTRKTQTKNPISKTQLKNPGARPTELPTEKPVKAQPALQGGAAEL